MKDKSKQDGLSGFITSIGAGIEKKIWVKDENDYTIQLSYLMGITWPLITEEYIYNFIKFLKELEFFQIVLGEDRNSFFLHYSPHYRKYLSYYTTKELTSDEILEIEKQYNKNNNKKISQISAEIEEEFYCK